MVSAPLTAPLRDARLDVDVDRSAPVGERIGAAAEPIGFFAVERGAMWGLVVAAGLIAALLVLRRGGRRERVIGLVVLGVGAGVLAGVIGATLYIAIKDATNDPPEEWLLQPLLVGTSGLLVGASFARLVPGARPAECRLAGLVGGLVAGGLTPLLDDPHELARAGILAMQAALAVGAVGAVLAVAAERRAGERDRSSALVRPPLVP